MARPVLEVADIFRDHGPAWRQANAGHVSLGQLKVMSAIESCRTAALGGHVARCEDCSHTQIAYNSCRNRHCPKCQGAAAREWLAEREAELLPVPYFHVVFTLPARIADIAYQNKTVIYDLLFKASSETMLTIAADPKQLGARIGFTLGAPHLGLRDDPEPSLKIPGIIISLIFSEQRKLVFRATPLQNQLAGAVEALNNAANGFSIQITAADLPRCTRSYLFALQQAGFNQPLDGVVTDAAYSRSFAQTHSLRIVQSSFLTGNRMVTPGCRYTGLIPPLPFARGIAASVQHRGDLVVAVSNSHATNDLQRLHGRGRFRCGTWSFHRELRMRASLPVNHQLKVFFILVSAQRCRSSSGSASAVKARMRSRRL